MKDKDTHLLEEAYSKINEAIEEVIPTPIGTYKVKLIKDREWNEWQVRILRLDGQRFRDLGDDVAYFAGSEPEDKQDAINTMKHMAQRLKEDPAGFVPSAK